MSEIDRVLSEIDRVLSEIDRGLGEDHWGLSEKKKVKWIEWMNGLKALEGIVDWLTIRSHLLTRFSLHSRDGKTATQRVESISAEASPTHCRSSLPPASTSLPTCRIARSDVRLHIADSHNSPRNSAATKPGSLRRIPQDTSPLSSQTSEHSQRSLPSSPSPVSPVSPISPREDGTPP